MPYEEKIFESLLVKLKRGKLSVLVGEFYRSPGSNTNRFMKHYDDFY